MTVQLEHINISVPDARATAQVLTSLFDWHVRWEGETQDKGWSVHVGSDDSYLALYSPAKGLKDAQPQYAHAGGLNHIGLVVDDLDAAEETVRAAGFAPHHHADYEPGRRLYFFGPDKVEYELVCYA